jgi:hypothetical protein
VIVRKQDVVIRYLVELDAADAKQLRDAGLLSPEFEGPAELWLTAQEISELCSVFSWPVPKGLAYVTRVQGIPRAKGDA